MAKDHKHEVESVISHYLDGYMTYEIAKEIGISDSKVRRILIDRGYDPDRSRGYAETCIEQWVAMYQGDWDGVIRSPNWIARYYGLSWATVALKLAERLGRLRHRRTYNGESRQKPPKKLAKYDASGRVSVH